MKTTFFLLMAMLLSQMAFSEDRHSHGVILLYHHVSNDTPESTSISPEKFQAHLELLKAEDAHVMPLSKLLDSIYNKRPLPEKAVAISFDDAYLSVYQNARPLLQELNYPYSLFVASTPANLKLPSYIGWPQLKQLVTEGVEMGGHSVNHPHLTQLPLDQAKEEILDNISHLSKQLGVKIKTFAYPYGEYNNELTSFVAEQGLFGLMQQSGAVGYNTPKGEIPRYIFANNYDSLDRLKTALYSRPLAIMSEQKTENQLIITLDPEHITYRQQQMACYQSSGQALPLKIKDNLLIVDLPKPQIGRNKINCTAPAINGDGIYYWHSYLWLYQLEDGSE